MWLFSLLTATLVNPIPTEKPRPLCFYTALLSYNLPLLSFTLIIFIHCLWFALGNTSFVLGSINTLTGIWLHCFLLRGLIIFCFCSNAKRGWRSGHLGFSLTCCSLFVPLSLVFLEKDEAAIESSEFNATSVADVDKRVKRRLLMGNSFLPLSMCCHGACACPPFLLLFLRPLLTLVHFSCVWSKSLWCPLLWQSQC